MSDNMMSYPTQEAKSKAGTGVGSPSGMGLRPKEWGPKVKV